MPCSCDISSPKGIAALALRLSLGLSLLLVGIAHYMVIEGYTGMVSSNLGALEPLGVLWAYILPALFIVGGALLTVGMYTNIAAWAAGIGLGSIPVGLLLKAVIGGASTADVMPGVINTFIWLILYYLVVKCSYNGSCGSSGG